MHCIYSNGKLCIQQHNTISKVINCRQTIELNRNIFTILNDAIIALCYDNHSALLMHITSSGLG